MQTYKTLDDAIALAEFAHRSQVDKAGLPYIDHPKRVLAKVQAQGALPYVQIAAILHDVTEDTRFTPDMLLALGFSEAAVNIIKLVDRDVSKAVYRAFTNNIVLERHNRFATENDYSKYAEDLFYYEQIRKNPDAKILKLADIADNMEPWRLSYFSDESRERKITKYTNARHLLGEEVAYN